MSSDTKLTRAQTKQHNRRLVLRVIYQGEAKSRADISRATSLTRTTASQAVADLIDEGLVAETGRGPSAGGKPPRLLEVVDDARYALGVDVSGYEVRGSVYDLRGKSVHRRTLPISETNGDVALDVVYELLDQLTLLADRPLLGIGLGVPGLLDAQRGIIRQAVNLGWNDLPLGDLLEERYDVPVYMVNDSQAAALAEYTFANKDRINDLAVLLVGRGISAGLVLGGQLYYGAAYSGASEIGHVRAVEAGELCACGHYGCLETVASQGAVVRWAQTVFLNRSDSPLRQYASQVDAVDIDTVLRAYRDGCDELAQIEARVGAYLGIAIAHLVAVLNLPLIVLTGSVSRFGDRLVASIQSGLEQCLLPALAQQTEVKLSALREDMVMLGAAALLLSNELGVV
jgi:predicted NBD/HSP70 family sugar kinase